MRLGYLYVVLVDEDEEAGSGRGVQGGPVTGIRPCFELVTAVAGIPSHDGNPTVRAARPPAASVITAHNATRRPGPPRPPNSQDYGPSFLCSTFTTTTCGRSTGIFPHPRWEKGLRSVVHTRFRIRTPSGHPPSFLMPALVAR